MKLWARSEDAGTGMRHPPRAPIAVVIAALLLAGLFTFAAAMAERTEHSLPVAGASGGCDWPACVKPAQVISSAQARRTKRTMGDHALVVDIRNADEAASAASMASDLRAPFMKSAGPSGMEFRLDFCDNVDDALRAARMHHDEPVILVSANAQVGVLAALLLQERGYSRVLVVRD